MPRAIDPADPRRCQGHKSGDLGGDQCSNLAVEGGEYCMGHGGFFAMQRQAETERRLYELTEARSQGRLTHLVKHDPTTFLYDVTGIAVLLLEKMQRATQQDMDFVAAYSDINTLMMVIERLKRATLHIQQNVTVLVPKAALYDLSRVLVELAYDEVGSLDDADSIVERISHRTRQLVRNAANEENLPSLEASQPLDRVKTFKLTNPSDAERLDELRHNDGLMSLYEEIAIQIIRIERRWNMVESDIELLAACSQLTQGLKNLERLIKSAHEQAQAIGELLTPVSRRQVVLEMVAAVTSELKRLPDFEKSIDHFRARLLAHFDKQTALPAPDEEPGSPSLELHG